MKTKKKEDKDIRYFIDIDLNNMKVIKWDFDDRFKLFQQPMEKPHYHRIYLTKGQYNKFVENLNL